MSRCSASNFASSIGLLTAPQCDVLLARRLADDELVVGRAAGVLSGAGDQRPFGGQLRLRRGEGLLVEGGRAQVPVDVAGANNAQGLETVRPLNLYRHLYLLTPRWPCGKKSAIVPVRGPKPQSTGVREAGLPERSLGYSSRRVKRSPDGTRHGRIPCENASTRRAVVQPTAPATPAPCPALSKDSELAGGSQGAGPRRRPRGRPRAVRRPRRAPAAARRPHRVSLPARRARRRRSGAGRVRQGVYAHHQYREDLPFEVWFTRILVNGCLDIGRRGRAGCAGCCRCRRSRTAPPAIRWRRSRSPEDAADVERARAADCRGRRAAAGSAARGVHALPRRRAEHERGERRRSASARRRCACICSAPSAGCGSCWQPRANR